MAAGLNLIDDVMLLVQLGSGHWLERKKSVGERESGRERVSEWERERWGMRERGGVRGRIARK